MLKKKSCHLYMVGNLIKDDIAIDLDRANKRFHAGYPVNMTSAAVDPQTSLGLAEGPALFQSTSVSLNRCVNKPALFNPLRQCCVKHIN